MLYLRNAIIVDDGLNAVTSPAAWHVEPAVRTAFSTRSTSVQPAGARWQTPLQPVIPPPMTTTRACSALMARNDTSVAGRGGPRVGEAAGRGVELPVVARRVKVEFDDAERPRGPELAVRPDRPEVAYLGAASPDHELADPARPILVAIGVLWRETFVVVVVAVDDEVGARVVERLPERVDRAIVAMEP